jgi:Amt family ammonium transporter
MATAVVSFQWFFWGYSLAFSHKAGKYVGALDNFGLMNVLGAPSVGSPRIPDLLFCVYQGMFAAITYVSAQEEKEGKKNSLREYTKTKTLHLVLRLQ